MSQSTVEHAHKNGSKRPTAVFLGHHKCATTWINSITQDVARRLGLKFMIVSNARGFGRDLPKYIAENEIDILSYCNAKIEHVRSLSNFRAFHVIRDPRDIVVSAYHSHYHSHSTANWPDLEKHRERLKTLSKDDGLRLEIEFSRWELEDLDRWEFNLPNVMEIKMEQLIVNPYDRLLEVFAFLGLADDQIRPRSATIELRSAATRWLHSASHGIVGNRHKQERLSVAEFLSIVYANRFSAKAGGRKPGVEDVKSHYRKGVARDWVNHLTGPNRQYFKSNFGELVQKLGYEASTDW
jgi:hypothetical protein